MSAGPLTSKDVSDQLRAAGSKDFAQVQSWFFKSGPGEYGEGDEFLGLRVPQIRAVSKTFANLPRLEIKKLALGKFHEERFAAVAILVLQFKKAKLPADRQEIFDLYLGLLDLGRVNNWDLIDASAPYLGNQLVGSNPMPLLLELADSGDLWKQRASIMLTFALIREFELEPTFAIVEHLIDHEHDLIHKAAGWMLREAGKKDLRALRVFLEKHAATMPRTMLRYAIEKMSKEERADWLSRKSQR